MSIRARRQRVESLTSADSRGVGVRVVVHGRLGYAYGADPAPAEVVELVRRAHQAAAFSEPDPANVLPAIGAPEPLPGLFREAELELGTERKVQAALDLERAAVSAHPEVRKVESVSFGDAVSRVAIASSQGGPIEYSRTDCWAAVSALAERDRETQTGFSFRLEREFADLPAEEAATEA